MSTLTETIRQLASTFVITQGKYNLTADAMRLRQQKPLHAGDDYTFEFILRDTVGDPVDLTAATLKFTAKYTPSDAEVEAIVTVVGVLGGDPTIGEFSVTLASADVPGPELIFGFYNVQITQGGLTETLIYGDIEFLPNIAE